jgi:hypothetical protein
VYIFNLSLGERCDALNVVDAFLEGVDLLHVLELLSVQCLFEAALRGALVHLGQLLGASHLALRLAFAAVLRRGLPVRSFALSLAQLLVQDVLSVSLDINLNIGVGILTFF